ncbi:Hsp70/Hsp90 co-chaperone CNS1 [Babesia microti strain RI]|uniref:Hsp70/Hsp90 co-chaperone CNS1 n=1 Tax=Babesia microti (strain RI) TaxID=1133968 RepID=A0A0K3AN39_BABMR|nr:Hsp70/Hsp90 co-chaperone CNS1 [Babesia microti strain RI]CTQ40927.1 Hsp70/Hsp90 co-chaperone CNS1 [Babesia microti strain RI]|eukprot:XP_012648938.1 Hsp70/Hsp90 co-chaperone CNS1 [Babesia microti strain RI]
METSAEVYEWTRDFLNTKNPLVSSCHHDHKQEIDLYNKPFEAKIEAAQYFRNKGNELYKTNDFKNAAATYTKGLLQLDYTFPKTDQEIEIFDKLRGELNANAAMTAIKMESYQSALHHCNQVLCDNPNNVKVLYRKGIALSKLNRQKEAKEILTNALKIDPENSAIRHTLSGLNKF